MWATDLAAPFYRKRKAFEAGGVADGRALGRLTGSQVDPAVSVPHGGRKEDSAFVLVDKGLMLRYLHVPKSHLSCQMKTTFMP